MLEIMDDTCQQRLDATRKFAQERGLLEDFEKKLKYLEEYACRKSETEIDLDYTKCQLFTDFAPHSFYFVMMLRNKFRNYECMDCKHRWSANVLRNSESPNLSGEVTQQCPQCQSRNTAGDPIQKEYKRWFNGGLIYYGPQENGVGDPQYSVRIGDTSQAGWSINT